MDPSDTHLNAGNYHLHPCARKKQNKNSYKPLISDFFLRLKHVITALTEQGQGLTRVKAEACRCEDGAAVWKVGGSFCGTDACTHTRARGGGESYLPVQGTADLLLCPGDWAS